MPANQPGRLPRNWSESLSALNEGLEDRPAGTQIALMFPFPRTPLSSLGKLDLTIDAYSADHSLGYISNWLLVFSIATYCGCRPSGDPSANCRPAPIVFRPRLGEIDR
jgi:hypothetical protein